MRTITVKGYYRKPTSVRAHKRQFSYVKNHTRTLSEFDINQVLQPKVTTTVEIAPDAEKLLKQLVYTLSGALVIAAVIRSR